MNNLFHAFKITIPGQLLDDKLYYQYDDFDGENLATPTDQQTLDKGIAYTRLQQLQRQLSAYEVPIYYTIEFGTPGTASTIPTDATIHVAYKSFEGYVRPGDVAFDQRLADAMAEMKEVLETTIAGGIENIYCVVQNMVTRKRFPMATDETQYREMKTIYIDVPPETVVVDVTHVQL